MSRAMHKKFNARQLLSFTHNSVDKTKTNILKFPACKLWPEQRFEQNLYNHRAGAIWDSLACSTKLDEAFAQYSENKKKHKELHRSFAISAWSSLLFEICVKYRFQDVANV